MKCARALAALVWLVACVAPVRAQTQSAVEYYHAGWNYYFVTSFPTEIAALDGGALGGVWKRTGQTFAVWSDGEAGTSEVCRFFSTSFAPRSSHFYTPFAAECENVRKNADWQYEAVSFHLKTPDASFNCPAGSVALYRLYNDGAGGAPNHRYTASRKIVAEMRSAGWTSEGVGGEAIFACVPELGNGSAEGIWKGTTSADEVVNGIILRDGTYYLAYAVATGTTDGGVFHGRATIAADQFAAPDGLDYPMPVASVSTRFAVPAGLSGTFSAQRALQLTIARAAGNDRLYANQVAGSNRMASVADVAGAYSGRWAFVGGDGQIATIAVEPTGEVRVQSVACRLAGTITPRLTVRAFDFTIRWTGGFCYLIIGTEAINGIAFYDDMTHTFRAFAPFVGGSNLLFLTGAR